MVFFGRNLFKHRHKQKQPTLEIYRNRFRFTALIPNAMILGKGISFQKILQEMKITPAGREDRRTFANGRKRHIKIRGAFKTSLRKWLTTKSRI